MYTKRINNLLFRLESSERLIITDVETVNAAVIAGVIRLIPATAARHVLKEPNGTCGLLTTKAGLDARRKIRDGAFGHV